jgi:hypothetical protein
MLAVKVMFEAVILLGGKEKRDGKARAYMIDRVSLFHRLLPHIAVDGSQ